MPVTPFHFGPGLIFKAVLGRRMSFGAFALANCVIDVESAANLLLGRYPVHDHLHTFAGSLPVAVAVAVVAPRPLSRLNHWVRTRGVDALAQQYLGQNRASSVARLARHISLDPALQPVTWAAGTAGAFLGAVSHVLLDAVIHADMDPLAPWREENPFLLSGSFVWMHVACAAAGVAALWAWPVLANWSAEDHGRPG